MDVLIVLVFVSLVLVVGSILLFLFTMNQRVFEHGEWLSLLPLTETNRVRVDGPSVDASGSLVVSTVAPGSDGSTDSQGSSES